MVVIGLTPHGFHIETDLRLDKVSAGIQPGQQ
jgi:hypothetical protein